MWQAMQNALAATDARRSRRPSGRRRRTILAADMPTVPLGQLQAAGCRAGRRQGLRASRQPERAVQLGLARQVVNAAGWRLPASPGRNLREYDPPGPSRPRGIVPSRLTRAGRRCEVHRPQAAGGHPGPVRAVDRPVRLRPPAARRPGDGHPRPARHRPSGSPRCASTWASTSPLGAVPDLRRRRCCAATSGAASSTASRSSTSS